MNYILLGQKVANFAYSTYNTLAKVKYFFSVNVKKIIKKNKQFKNKHAGERCFILGLGPSLKNNNLELIKNEKVFALNSFYKYLEGASIEPDYYFMIDNLFHGENIDEVRIVKERYKKTEFFFNIRGKKAIEKHLSSDSKNNSNYLYSKLIQNGDLIKCDAAKNMTAAMNVVLACIQIAIYMGFKEIYLLGCDFNYIATNFKQYHCYDEKHDPEFLPSQLPISLRNQAATIEHHNALEKFSKKVGVKIYNATTGSYIPSYEFIKYENIINNKSTFEER